MMPFWGKKLDDGRDLHLGILVKVRMGASPHRESRELWCDLGTERRAQTSKAGWELFNGNEPPFPPSFHREAGDPTVGCSRERAMLPGRGWRPAPRRWPDACPSAVPERGLRRAPGRAGGEPPLARQEEQLAHDPAQGQLRAARAARVPAQAQPPAQDHVGAAARPARHPQARARPEPAGVRQGPRAAPARAQLGARSPPVRVGALRAGLCTEQGGPTGLPAGPEEPPSPRHRPCPAFSLPCLSSSVRPEWGGTLPSLGGLLRLRRVRPQGLRAAAAAPLCLRPPAQVRAEVCVTWASLTAAGRFDSPPSF